MNATARTALLAMPLPNAGGNNYVNGNAVLKQDSNNGSMRVDWIATERTNVFGRYSVSDENSVIPDVVPDRDRLGFVGPQNNGLGLRQGFPSNSVNRGRAWFKSFYVTGSASQPT